MLYSDPVTFYSMLSEYRTMEYAQTSTWVLAQPADLLFQHAQELIFSKGKGTLVILDSIGDYSLKNQLDFTR